MIRLTPSEQVAWDAYFVSVTTQLLQQEATRGAEYITERAAEMAEAKMGRIHQNDLLCVAETDMCGVDAIHAPFQMNIHQDQIGVVGNRSLHGSFAAGQAVGCCVKLCEIRGGGRAGP